MHTDANIHAGATLSIIYYYKTYSYNNNHTIVQSVASPKKTLVSSPGILVINQEAKQGQDAKQGILQCE